jgi:hypothetical protein
VRYPLLALLLEETEGSEYDPSEGEPPYYRDFEPALMVHPEQSELPYPPVK